jgi:hypothetical protein
MTPLWTTASAVVAGELFVGVAVYGFARILGWL